MRKLQLNRVYRHFKHKNYLVLDVATHSETKEKYVVYRALYGDCGLYIRPYDMFMSEVDYEKYPDVKQKYRFELVEEKVIYEVNTIIAAPVQQPLYINTGLKVALVEEIISYAKQYGVEKLYLFGSRARGDYKERSDIDLAFIGGDASRFILAMDEDTYTLLSFDVVDLGKPVQEELLESIRREGVLLYEK